MPTPSDRQWEKLQTIEAKNFKCKYCDNVVASDLGYRQTSRSGGYMEGFIVVCPFCRHPTYFLDNYRQIPGTTYGDMVSDIDNKDIKEMYAEARNCFSVNSFTSTVMCCRKILMQIAVDQGADEGMKFVQYVDYLVAKHIVPEKAKAWVGEIRTLGNEANHEIHLMNSDQARNAIDFTSMLLKILYEYPSRMVVTTEEEQK